MREAFRVSSGNDPFMEKITSEHLGKALDYSEANSKRISDDSRYRSKILLLVIIIVLVFLLLLCWMFISSNKPELLKDVLTHLVAFVGGGGLGIGAKNLVGKLKN